MAKRVAEQVAPDVFLRRTDLYRTSLDNLEKTIRQYQDFPEGLDKAWSKYWWGGVIESGRKLAAAVISMKAVPPGKAKAFEMALRLVNTSARPPADLFKWYAKNATYLKLLLEAATQWGDRTEGGDDLIKVGPFTVHNTMGLSGKDLDGVKKSIEKAIVAIRRLKVPGIEKVLYGDIHFVARIQRAKWLAWYESKTDDIFVRPTKNSGHDEVRSFIHELGHRYVRRFADRRMLYEFAQHHARVGLGGGDVEIPKPGELLPLSKPPAAVTKVIPGVRIELEGNLFVPWRSYVQTMERYQTALKYPTLYAATNWEEHFCEALALAALNSLPSPHLEAFERIVEGKSSPQPSLDVQRIASTYVRIDREELEEWLDTLPLKERWYRLPGKTGIYMLPLSDNVAIKLSSTIGKSEDAMGRGMASMQLALVSRVVENRFGPMVLNKKAQGQSHFARTKNWRTNWKEGVGRMKDAYIKSAGFYDALALIENREQYQRDMLKRIEAIPEWRNHNVISDFHTRVTQGGILTTAQVELLSKIENDAKRNSVPNSRQPARVSDEALLAPMRQLYVVARKQGDQWLMDFLTSVGRQVKSGRSLTPKQHEVLTSNFTKYRIPFPS